ncbi:hypothetical protein SI65_08061 [Aspergillus cristatus]|uniref:Uncharacterized protein n=1 Tax=Aspergillus cristatus TaxID=573508 RepID=A0A1E3B6K6_ASPCR|nr:hypothetical protein SI65_08061 [Aspergillus cristatus]
MRLPLKVYGFDYDADEADEIEEDVEDEWIDEDDEDGWIDDDDDEEDNISEFSDKDYLRSPFL